MELLSKNYAQTTTQFIVNSNTATVANVLNPDVRFQYASDTFNDDNTTVSMKISFVETLTVDRIALVAHNLKAFRVYYNGVTANSFSLSSPADTVASSFLTNSQTSHYMRCTPQACTSVSIDMMSTITPNQNKYLGYLVLSQKLTNFNGRVPSANNYRPSINPEAVIHKLSDGGTRIQTLEDKWNAQLNFDFIDKTTRDELKVIFDDHEEMVFAPFGTMTGWDAIIFPCVWGGSFDFFKYSDNAAQSGFSGAINLFETPQ